MMGYGKDMELGRHLAYQIDRYIQYRYSSVFLKDAGAPCLESMCKYDPPTHSYRYKLKIWMTAFDYQFFADMRIDATKMEQIPDGRDRSEWLMYACQGMLPYVDTGIFSCWFVTRLPKRLGEQYNMRILPNMERIKLLPFNDSRDKIDHGSLVVFYLKNGGEWREVVHNINVDPEAFLANLLMLTP